MFYSLSVRLIFQFHTEASASILSSQCFQWKCPLREGDRRSGSEPLIGLNLIWKILIGQRRAALSLLFVIVRMVVLRIEREWELWNSFFCEQYNLMRSTFQFPPSEMRGEDIELKHLLMKTKYPEKVTPKGLKELVSTVLWSVPRISVEVCTSHLILEPYIFSINRDLVGDAQWCVSKKDHL